MPVDPDASAASGKEAQEAHRKMVAAVVRLQEVGSQGVPEVNPVVDYGTAAVGMD